MSDNGQWQNRIVGYKVKRASELTIHPENARKHPQYQRDAVEASLDTLGWIAPVIENIASGYVVDGNERSWQALGRGDDTPIPVIEVDLSPEEEAQALATFDFITYLAEYDKDNLNALLHQFNSDNEHIQSLVSSLASDDVQKLLDEVNSKVRDFGDNPEIPDAPEPQIDRAEELQEKWQVKRGDLWQIGKHRLLCGDSTNEDDVKRVMGGEKADLIITSPPYPGADMWNDENENTQSAIKRLDDLNYNLLCSAWSILKDNAVCLWNVADVPYGNHGVITTTTTTTTMAVGKIGYSLRGKIIWNKISPNLTPPSFMRRPCIPSLCHEEILILFKGDWVPREPKSGIPQDDKQWMAKNVWDISPESAKRIGHKAPYPIELPRRCLNLWSLDSDVVMDLCGGSGTTMVACEQLNRQCRMIEIEEKYCSVILDRMSDIGLQPELISNA
jgi:DNA modification methylase